MSKARFKEGDRVTRFIGSSHPLRHGVVLRAYRFRLPHTQMRHHAYAIEWDDRPGVSEPDFLEDQLGREGERA